MPNILILIISKLNYHPSVPTVSMSNRSLLDFPSSPKAPMLKSFVLWGQLHCLALGPAPQPCESNPPEYDQGLSLGPSFISLLVPVLTVSWPPAAPNRCTPPLHPFVSLNPYNQLRSGFNLLPQLNLPSCAPNHPCKWIVAVWSESNAYPW